MSAARRPVNAIASLDLLSSEVEDTADVAVTRGDRCVRAGAAITARARADAPAALVYPPAQERA